MQIKWLISIHILFIALLTTAQVQLTNASFEGVPVDATMPRGWFGCTSGTTPDILPGPWDVTLSPYHGISYLGLITREEGSWESVGQQLETPLEGKQCYTFTAYLAHSDTYAGYNLPIRLRIWGGYDKCDKDQLLQETGIIEHLDWREYTFQFATKKEIRYIIFEAYYAPGLYFHYNGNVLIDNCSVIRKCRGA